MTNIEDRTWDVAFEKTLLICSHGSERVCMRSDTGTAPATVDPAFAFLKSKSCWELRLFFSVGISKWSDSCPL